MCLARGVAYVALNSDTGWTAMPGVQQCDHARVRLMWHQYGFMAGSQATTENSKIVPLLLL